MNNIDRPALLQQKIAERLAQAGSIDTAEFMALAMADKEHGYYAAAEPFGQRGDFITAPEISQLFGEMVALWLITAWQALGSPAAFALCEAGPGRGTLSDDILRSLHKAAPACARAAHIVLMETSPALRQQQQRKLAPYNRPEKAIAWVEDSAGLSAFIKSACPAAPLLLVANELLDALPVCQYEKSAQAWHIRQIKMTESGALHFARGPAQALPPAADDAAFVRACGHAPPGAIVEISPARQDFVRDLSRLLARQRGAALLVDYGALKHGFGDTLQAVAKHRFAAVLENIGRQDLSSHVDFAALRAVAQQESCHSAALTQGEFLLQMGLLERAGCLGADKSDKERRQISADVTRLAAPEQMGALFKILCIADADTIMPPFQW